MRSFSTSIPMPQKAVWALLLCAALPVVSVLDGCSGSSAGSSTTSTTAATTSVQMNIGDSPADWMLAFSMNIASMTLTGANGTTTVVSSSTPTEMMHLMGSMQPLTLMSIPQGTYTGASITIGSASVMYMDPTTKSVVQSTISGPMTGNVTFGTPVTVGSTPMSMGFDLNLASSVTQSGSSLSMTPVFTMTSSTQTASNPMDFANGAIYQMMGSVSSVSGSTFTMTSMQAAKSMSFTTNSSTTFTGTSASMSAMASGTMVLVDASLQTDGTLLASRVQSMGGSGGVMSGGMVTVVAGTPATSIDMTMHNGTGTGMMSSYLAAGAAVTLNSSTTYQMDTDQVSMTGLPFTPVFDASHVYAGQSVLPIGTGSMMSGGMGSGMMSSNSMAGTMTASELMLEPQSLTGTAGAAISSGTATSFTLTLPADSAFTSLTGATSILVYQQQQTVVAGSATIASGTSVHGMGLLFYDGGQWKMVAARIAAS